MPAVDPRDHVGLALVEARRFGRLSGRDWQELLAYAWFGLAAAAESYDPTSGTAFSTYAGHRMRGAMRDGLRTEDHLSRHHRRAQTRIQRARTLGVTTPEGLARLCDVSVECARQWLREEVREVVELDAPPHPHPEGRALTYAQTIEYHGLAPDVAVERAELWAAVERLPLWLRETVLLVHRDALPKHEVARRQGVTPSAVSYRLRRAYQELRRVA